MALDDVKHVEAVAIMRQLIEDGFVPTPLREATEGWLTENRPPPTAYMAAMRSMVVPREDSER